MNKAQYEDKLQGAIIGRFAGCALGAPVEMMELNKLKEFCHSINQEFPPTTYFKKAPNPNDVRYKVGKGSDFTKEHMQYLSTDDDIMYTLLSLLMMEAYGTSLQTKDVADSWLKYLPLACTFTAERTTLSNLKNGIEYQEAYKSDQDQTEFIGAAIRIDGYAYVFPGEPQKAVQLAEQDAQLSHRNSGLDSARYFTALISLAFTSTNIVDSLYQALDYIPSTGWFYQEIVWALSVKETVVDYQTAYDLVTKRFSKMDWAHAINNACLTVWGIYLGRNSYTTGITQTVAMTYDNDCTAATVGSVLGAYLGKRAIEDHWYHPWNNTILSYLHGIETFQLDDVIQRFATLRETFHNQKM